MPEKTLEAVADHGEIRGDVVRDSYHDANKLLDAIDKQGISYTEVTQLLEDEGVEKFVTAWDELKQAVSSQLDQAR